ncbi:hypothetical protein [Pseudodesulfovibrio sp.]|uniref:DUF6848 family protein n=1 Tax=unclassified Pseudodesulfovibrio TaxID=2661612 RepID=UPI003AFFE9D5
MAENEPIKATEFVELNHEFFDRFKDKDVSFKFHFKRPSTPQVQRVQKTVLKNAGQAFKNLIMETIQPEEKAQLKEALEDYSGLASTFGGALMSSCGFGDLGN